jgi:acetyltransferase
VITLRPIGPADAPAFQAFVQGLSLASRTNRFLFPVREVAPDLLRVLTHADQQRHVALAAVDDHTGAIIGEGRFVALGGGGRAEFAVAVSDAWQRRGIGARLLAALVSRARGARLQFLEGEILHNTNGMLQFLRATGFRLRNCPGDASVVLAELELALAPRLNSPLDFFLPATATMPF